MIDVLVQIINVVAQASNMRVEVFQLVLERPNQLYFPERRRHILNLIFMHSVLYLQGRQRLFRDRKRFGRIYLGQAESKE